LSVRWRSFESWVGTRGSALALFGLALAVFALESVFLPVYPGRDMGRYVQAFVQLGYDTPVLPSVLVQRGPLASVGVGGPLEIGGWAAEIWLAVLYASSVVAWGAVAMRFGARAAIATAGLLLLWPGYGILFHELASDSLFAAGFAGWAVLLSRALARPSTWRFLAAGAGMGSLVLIRPGNQSLIGMALLPLLLRVPWGRRLTWVVAYFVGSVAVTQGWQAVQYERYGTAVAVKPSSALLGTVLVLLPVLLPRPWRLRAAVVAVAAAAALAVVRGVALESPAHYTRILAQGPGADAFLFRAYELDRIVAPDNGPASRQLAEVVQSQLLTKEPYRSYGVTLQEVFSSGSDRIFQDIQTLGGADLQAVAGEAIRTHWRTFAGGVARAVWDEMWTRRVFTPNAALGAVSGEPAGDAPQPEYVVVAGRRLPKPTEGQPIPASRFGIPIQTVGGQAREVWRSPADHPLVFDDARDGRRYAKLLADTRRLSGRLPVRDAHEGVAHRLNQASHAFPPAAVWALLGAGGLVVRRPRRMLEALAPAIAATAVIVATCLIAAPVAEYAAPVTPAYILLAAVGLVGLADPARPGWRALRRRARSAGTGGS
jgi:hypothetical protein